MSLFLARDNVFRPYLYYESGSDVEYNTTMLECAGIK